MYSISKIKENNYRPSKTYDFIPKTDMSELFDKMSNNSLFLKTKHVHYDIKFTDMQHVPRLLDEVQEMILNNIGKTT